MNKRTVLASLNKIANELDNNGLYTEASAITKVMKKLAMDDMPKYQNDNFAKEDYMYSDENDDDFIFDQELFNKMIQGLREIFMPYGDEDDDMDMDEDMDDMGFESEPFDFSSPEDEGDMYGEADGSDYGDDF